MQQSLREILLQLQKGEMDLDQAELLLKEDGTAEEIRRAQTPADYFATLDSTPYREALREAARLAES